MKTVAMREFIMAHRRQSVIALIVAALSIYVLFGTGTGLGMKLGLVVLLIIMGWVAGSKRDQVREYIRKNTRESMVMLMDGLLVLYILFVPKFPTWQKLLVSVVLIFGGYEVIQKMRGKPSPMDGMRKGMAEAQKGIQESQKAMQKDMAETMSGMQMGDMGLPQMGDMGGFGPFRQQKPRRKKK